MKLQQEISKIENTIEDLEDALTIIKNPPKWQPKPGENLILDTLKREFAAPTEAAERQRKLDITEKALQKAQEELAIKQAALEELEIDCAAIAEEMELAAAEVLEIQEEFHLAINRFKKLARKNLDRWRQLHLNALLVRDSSDHWEAPTFTIEGSGRLIPLRHIDPEERARILALLAGE